MIEGQAIVIVESAIVALLVAPASLLALIGVPTWLGWSLSEAAIGRLTRVLMTIAFLAGALALATHVLAGAEPWTASLGTWLETGVTLDFMVDTVSLSFATLAVALCGVDAAYSTRYLHREPGYARYFATYALFTLGITAVALAGSVEVLFAGWEFLGLSSALLIGFFHERREPVANALRVFAVYRLSDAAMLTAVVLMHHWAGTGSLAHLFYGDSLSATALDGARATVIALLLLLAVAGKSGLLPFSGWLPRAMEGPTSSSAVFYGSLSIHAGCYLLLRAEPLFALAPVARILTIAAGVATAIHATLSARVQTDVKSALTYAALTQVSLIVVEIGLGLTTIAFVHMVGHACYRLLQFLSAPNILHDLHELENALGERLDDDRGQVFADDRGAVARRRLYLWALERGFVDALLDRFVVAPFVAVATALDRLDRLLCGPSAEPTPKTTREERGDD